MNPMERLAQVTCYAGRKYPERPTSFVWQDEEQIIEAIEGEWMTPEGPHFWVRTSVGEHFHLVYSQEADQWYLKVK